MPDISCPACGAGGRVPRDKMNVRLVCKKCLRVFHLTPTGHPVMGEPPAAKDAPKEKAVRETGYELRGPIDSLLDSIAKFKLPKVSPQTLGMVAGAIVVLGLGYFLLARQSLEKRNETMIRALMTTDMKTVMDFSVPGTEMDTIIWYNNTYKEYMDLKLALGGQDAGLKVNVLDVGKSGLAVVVTQLSSEGTRLHGAGITDATNPIPSLSNTKSMIELHTYWLKDGFGNWRFDGKRSLQGAP
jgi:hypothetical protein